MDVIQRLEPVIIEIERERECVVVVAHQAILRALYGYFMKIPLSVRVVGGGLPSYRGTPSGLRNGWRCFADSLNPHVGSGLGFRVEGRGRRAPGHPARALRLLHEDPPKRACLGQRPPFLSGHPQWAAQPNLRCAGWKECNAHVLQPSGADWNEETGCPPAGDPAADAEKPGAHAGRAHGLGLGV